MVKINEISKDNSKYTSKELIDNSINSILVNPADRTIWINGNPYGIAFVSPTINDDMHPKHAAILNDYQSNTALGDYSIAIGKKTKTTNEGEFACGKYNISKGEDTNIKTLFTIGNGKSDTNTKNVFEVLDNSKIYIEGIGNYDGITIDTDTVSLQDYISSLTGGVGKIYYNEDKQERGIIFNDYDHNKAEGTNSVAFGTGTITSNDSEAAFGKYNNSTVGETIFSIGEGTSNSDRKNVLEVKNDGSLYLKDDDSIVEVKDELKSSSKVNYILNGNNFKYITYNWQEGSLYNHIGLIEYSKYNLDINENNNLVFKDFIPNENWSHIAFKIDPNFISENNLNKTFNFKVILRSIDEDRHVRIGFRNGKGNIYFDKYGEEGINLTANVWKTIQYDFVFEEYAGLNPMDITAFILITQTNKNNNSINNIEIKEIGVYDGKYCENSIQNQSKIYNDLEYAGFNFEDKSINKLHCSNDLGEVIIENGEIKLYDKVATLSDVSSNLKVIINNDPVKSNVNINDIKYNLNGFKLTDQSNYITYDSNYTYIGHYNDDSKKLRLFIDNSSNTYSGYKFLIMPKINILTNIKFNSKQFLNYIKNDLNMKYTYGYIINSCNLNYYIDYKYLNNNFNYGTNNCINIYDEITTYINTKLNLNNNPLGENITILDNKNYELLNTIIKFNIDVYILYKSRPDQPDYTNFKIITYTNLIDYIELSSSENSVTINFNDANTDTYELSLKEYINYTHIGKNGLKTVNYIEDKHMQFVATTDGILMQFGNYKLGVDSGGIWYDPGNGQKKQLT